MKQLLYLFIIAAFFSTGCGKENTYSNEFSSAAFINASPFRNPLPGNPTINMRVFVDTLQKTGSNVVYTGSSGYLSLQPGTRDIQVRSSLDFTTVYAEAADEQFAVNTASTFVVYDSVNSATGRARILRLSDTLTLPPAGFIKVRFLPLAVTQAPMDVTLLRTSVTPNDSVTFFNQAYVGASPSPATLAALSTFRTIPSGAYTVRLKQAGTQTVIATQPLTLANLTGTGNITGINTIFATGTAAGQPIRVGLFRHYP